MAKRIGKVTKDFSEELQTFMQETQAPGLLGKIITIGLQKIMEAERDAYIGADSYERSRIRRIDRNGYKPRQLNTRVGCITLQIPQTRDGKFYPSILERYQRSEKALVLALAEAYLQGVSTRKMKKLTEELLGREFSSSTISRYAEELDLELESWRKRPFNEEYPYVIVDARYDKCRVGAQIVDIAVFTAIGIDRQGYRRFLSLEVNWGETNTSWDKFFEGLKARGLRGVKLFTSDDHGGIRNAIRKHFAGTAWQRCQRHFLVHAMDMVAKRYRDQVQEELSAVWSSSSWRQAKERLELMAARWSEQFEALSDFLSEEGWETLTVYTICPGEHRKKLRTSNIVERVNQEFKRRG